MLRGYRNYIYIYIYHEALAHDAKEDALFYIVRLVGFSFVDWVLSPLLFLKASRIGWVAPAHVGCVLSGGHRFLGFSGNLTCFNPALADQKGQSLANTNLCFLKPPTLLSYFDDQTLNRLSKMIREKGVSEDTNSVSGGYHFINSVRSHLLSQGVLSRRCDVQKRTLATNKMPPRRILQTAG